MFSGYNSVLRAKNLIDYYDPGIYNYPCLVLVLMAGPFKAAARCNKKRFDELILIRSLKF
jgi:hypothetical protein